MISSCSSSPVDGRAIVLLLPEAENDCPESWLGVVRETRTLKSVLVYSKLSSSARVSDETDVRMT